MQQFGGIDPSAVRAWSQTLQVTVRAMRTTNVVAAGTAAPPQDISATLIAGPSQGTWMTETQLGPGDSYLIRSYAPEDPVFKDAAYVFHFAGIGDIVPSIERPAEYLSTNVQGTVRMLECARNAGVAKFVYAASSSCYGIARVPTTEILDVVPLRSPRDTKYTAGSVLVVGGSPGFTGAACLTARAAFRAARFRAFPACPQSPAAGR